METVIDYLLKSAGVLSIFVLVYHFLLRRLTFFNANRWFLLLGIAASILFPLVEITQTVYVEQPEQITMLPQQLATPMAFMLQPTTPVEVVEPFNYGMLALYLYLAISLFFIGKMCVELISLRRLILSGNKKIDGKFVMVTLSRKLTPFSFFNYICYSDTDQQSRELDLIIDHEKVHAREWHSIDLLVSHVFRAVFWINPLVWLLKRQIGENLEFIADSKAKTQNTSGISYERTLLSTVASHMQPALANNFFTPFIKKRIVMLQKEASANWNAYKYALILPVIVLFLYSFNVVEEIEYIKKENAKTVNAIASATTVKELVFDITSTTTDAQLEKYRKQIDIQAIYQVKFTTVKRDKKGNLETIAVAAKYPNMDWENVYAVDIEENTLILLKANPEEMHFHFPKEGITMEINEKGSVTQIDEEILYGNQPKVTDVNQYPIIDFDHTINFSIEPTSTEEYLDEKKAYLKKEYNVDFDYRKLKIKKGKIVRIKISIDDNNGYKGSQDYSATDGIKPICIKGVIKGDSKSWSMGSCEGVTNRNNYSYNLGHFDFTKDSDAAQRDMDSTLRMLKRSLKNISFDSLNIEFDKLDFEFENINMDSLLNNASIQFKSLDIDSLQNELQIQFKNMNMDSLMNNKKVIYLNNPHSVHTFKNGVSTRTLTQEEVDNYRKNNEGKKPLIIINGVIAQGQDMNTIDPNTIESVSVLKNDNATSMYGDKAKDGAVIISTKMNAYDSSYKSRHTASKGKAHADSLRSEMELKRDKMMEKHNEMRSKYSIRRDSLVNDRTEKMQEKRAEMEEKRAELMEKRDSIRFHKNSYIVSNDSHSISDDIIESEFHFDDMSEDRFEKLKERLEEAGHTFKLRTHRIKNDRLVKLKFDIDGSQYAYQSNQGYKEIWIKFFKGNSSPSITLSPFN